MRFIDRIHVNASPSSRLTKNTGIETMKGHFPLLVNRPEHSDYEGDIPDEFYFEAQNTEAELYDKDFKPWYYNFKLSGKEWNFWMSLTNIGEPVWRS